MLSEILMGIFLEVLMHKKFIKVAAVLLAFGLILAGCSGPFATLGTGVSSRALADPDCTFTVSYDAGPLITMPGGNQSYMTAIKLTCNLHPEEVYITYCADYSKDTNQGWQYKSVSGREILGDEKADEVLAIVSFLNNYYADLPESLYTAVVQGVIWYVVNGLDVDQYTFNDANVRELVVEAVEYVKAHRDDLIQDWNFGINIEGTAGDGPSLFGPYNVRYFDVLKDVDFALSMTAGNATFVDAAGNAITSVKPGEEFFVKIAAGASGDFEFKADASATRQFNRAYDFYFFIELSDWQNGTLGSQPLYQPLFQPLFQPLLNPEFEHYIYSCIGSFFVVPPEPLKGGIDILKTVDGINIIARYDVAKLKTLVSFELWQNGKKVAGPVYLNAQGRIVFGDLKAGTYEIREILTAAGAQVFEQAAPVTIYVGEGKTVGSTDFDYNAHYTIVNGYGSGYTLGYPGLNNSGDIFYIGVTNTSTGVEYASYCANGGSTNFGGDAGQGCEGYYVGFPFDKAGISMDMASYLSALNYIEDNYGSLNDNRGITQTVIWALLGAIDVNSPEFAGIDARVDQAAVKAALAAAANGYAGKGKIVDLTFMVCDKHDQGHDYTACQPQLVPIYTGSFQNVEKPVLKLSPAYGSVTATNAGNVPAILAGLNPKNGNPLFDKKDPENPKVSTPFVVPNANHFTFAKFTLGQLKEGVELDMVVGNKYEIVGAATVKLVDGKIEITFNNLAKGSFGAVAFSSLPQPSNGNIHSQKEKDLQAWGAVTGFNSDSKTIIPLPKNVAKDGDFIYLYIHGDFQFYL